MNTHVAQAVLLEAIIFWLELEMQIRVVIGCITNWMYEFFLCKRPQINEVTFHLQ